MAERGDHVPAVEQTKSKEVSGKRCWKRGDHIHPEGGEKAKEVSGQRWRKEPITYRLWAKLTKRQPQAMAQRGDHLPTVGGAKSKKRQPQAMAQRGDHLPAVGGAKS
jgi:hypothetical protein